MTPVPEPVLPGQCHVWSLPTDQVPPVLLGLLDADERQRYDRFLVADAKALYLAAHVLVRLVLAAQTGRDPAALRFAASCKGCGGAHGKPRLLDAGAPLEFSLSHSGQLAVVAVSHGTEGAVPVGVDVERVAERTTGLPEAVLTPAERAELARLPAADQSAGLIRYWARKEAVLKATGDGLSVGPRRLSVSAPDRPPRLLDWSAKVELAGGLDAVYLSDLDFGPGYRGAVATLGRPTRVVERDVSDTATLLAGVGRIR